MAVVTSLEAKDPVAAAVKLAGDVLAEDEAQQIAAHEAVWRDFWSASGVALADAYLESVWYRNLYFLRCCSKPGVPPIGLFMGCATDVMPWHGCATTDYNFEQAFWGAFACNHAELAEPYNRYMVDYLPRGKWFAKETYGLDGAFYPVNHFTHQIFDPAVCKSKNRHMNFYLPWTYVPGANGWQAHNVWLAYLYHPDRLPEALGVSAGEGDGDLLRRLSRTMPEDAGGQGRLRPDLQPGTPRLRRGRHAVRHRVDPLHAQSRDPRRDRARLRRRPGETLAGGTGAGAGLSAHDEDGAAGDCRRARRRADQVQRPRADVAGVPGRRSQLVVAGRGKGDLRPDHRDHRHHRLQLGDDAGRCPCPAEPAGHARVDYAEFQKRQMPNGYLQLLGDTRGNYSEQMAAAGIVSELLLQSVGDMIRVFPAWPKDKDARFTNLRAQGGFLVSAEQKAGKVVKLEITSTVGGKLRLLNPWTGQLAERETKPGESLDITP